MIELTHYEDGDGIFHPTQMVKLIPVVTKLYAEKNGLVVVNHIPDSDKSNQVVASNNLENNL